jgi:hypothetical protein
MKSELEKRRERFEQSLDDLRDSIDAELGWVPRLRRWALPIAVAAAGLVVGLGVRRALPRRRQRRRLR